MGLALRDLDDMTEEGLALLQEFARWAVDDHNKRVKAK